MGLDIKFNYKKAVDCGMNIIYVDDGYPLVQIPGTDMMTDIDLFGDTGIVRANKWGRMYEPLTKFLKDNNISFVEIS